MSLNIIITVETVATYITRGRTAVINGFSGFFQLLALFVSIILFISGGNPNIQYGGGQYVMFLIFAIPTWLGFIMSLFHLLLNINNKYNLDHATATIGNAIFVLFYLCVSTGFIGLNIAVIFVIPSFALTSIGAALQLLPQ